MNNIEKFPGIDEEFVKKRSMRITDDDINKVIHKSEEIKDKFKTGGPLGRFIEDFRLLIAVIGDYWSGAYREIPWWAVSAIAFGLLYVLNPFDIIPDVIPVVGQLDDAAVIAVVLVMIEQELQKYKDSKLEHP